MVVYLEAGEVREGVVTEREVEEVGEISQEFGLRERGHPIVVHRYRLQTGERRK